MGLSKKHERFFQNNNGINRNNGTNKNNVTNQNKLARLARRLPAHPGGLALT